MMLKTMILAAAGVAGLALSTQAPAQYSNHPYRYGISNDFAAQRCTAAVQYRLDRRATVRGSFEHLGGRVLSVTEIRPRGNIVRVRGTAVSERMAYGPYGYGAYGALGAVYAQPGDLTFRCDLDRRGRVQRVDINRR